MKSTGINTFRRFKLYGLSLFFFTFSLSFQAVSQENDKQIFDKVMKTSLPAGKAQRILKIAEYFQESPYVANTLDINPKEELVVNLRDFDCATFVESCIALGLTTDQSFETFQKNLQKLRYRGGKIEHYGSRLHYFTDWLSENERKGIIKNVSRECGGKPFVKVVDFMTAHVGKYPQLENYRALEAVRMAEVNLDKQKLFFIPKTLVSKIENYISDGDIIAITTSLKGLDVSHEGFAIRQNGRIHLLHASLDLKKVVITNEPLAEYLAKHPAQTGIMVARIAGN